MLLCVFFLLTVYVSPVFYGPLWTDFSINGWMDNTLIVTVILFLQCHKFLTSEVLLMYSASNSMFLCIDFVGVTNCFYDYD